MRFFHLARLREIYVQEAEARNLKIDIGLLSALIEFWRSENSHVSLQFWRDDRDSRGKLSNIINFTTVNSWIRIENGSIVGWIEIDSIIGWIRISWIVGLIEIGLIVGLIGIGLIVGLIGIGLIVDLIGIGLIGGLIGTGLIVG
jgi:hypothetical protein